MTKMKVPTATAKSRSIGEAGEISSMPPENLKHLENYSGVEWNIIFIIWWLQPTPHLKTISQIGYSWIMSPNRGKNKKMIQTTT